MTAAIVATSASPARALAEQLAILRRRRVPLIATLGVVLTIAVVVAFVWPATYRSTGTILIEQQELPPDLVRSTISSYADQRIQVITQRVMTTENLFRIIERFDLYGDKRRTRPREAIIQRMRNDIHFEMISADVIDPRNGNPTKATIAFAVSFSERSPDRAARVANELVSLYLQENMQSRRQRSADATTFLTAEGDRLNARSLELGEQLAGFKSGHANDLPELAPLNLQQLNRAAEELREIDARARSIEQQIVLLDAQLAQLNPISQVYTATGERVLSATDRLKFLRTEYARAAAIYSPSHPDVVRLRMEIAGLEKTVDATGTMNDLERQLNDARSQLAAAQQRYGAAHPDIVQLEHLVNGLEGQLREAGRAQPDVGAGTELPDNPAYIQVKAQRDTAANERAGLERQRAEVRSRIADYESRMANGPEVEREYLAMVQDLNNTQLKYQEVRQKQMEAQLAQNLEEGRKGERFTLIEPPLPPQEPASPNRLVILVLGVIFAVGAGIGTIAVLELADGSVRGRRGIEALLTVPPLAVVPWIETDAERATRARWRRLSFAGAAGSVVAAAVFVHLFYRPLDVLWEVALRRLIG